jgi:hypothetical protein
MNFTGYLIEGTYDGETLRVTPKNRASRVALMGDAKAPDLAISRQHIANITSREPGALVNGHITLWAGNGSKFILHFRNKQKADYRALVDALG